MAEGNAAEIEKCFLATFNPETVIGESEIREKAIRFRLLYPIPDDEFEFLIKRLHSKLAVRMDTGVVLVESEVKPWLASRKADLDWFFWNRYSQYLKSRLKRPPGAVQALDRISDRILDLLGDPENKGAWTRRGLVMGEVQSGKTSTYTGLICKASDAGFRLVILIAGTTEILRKQTQERLDEGFVGRDSSRILSKTGASKVIGVGDFDRSRFPGVFTSIEGDFNSTLMNQLGFRLSSYREPVLLVVKKDRSILSNLRNWLRSHNAEPDGKISIPLLLIDDEADNASINTNSQDQDPTAINREIRTLLNLFHRNVYLGFTATPFANIFINPDSDDQMRGDDLFPRHFIYALEPPTNYTGPQEIFGSEAETDIIRSIHDAGSIFPHPHKSDLSLSELPGSLLEAIRSFIIINAIRDLRGEGPTHRSMLINVSRYNNVQDQVMKLVDKELYRLQEGIRHYSRLDPIQASRHETIADLGHVWEKEFEEKCEFSWNNVQKSLLAALSIGVIQVNMKSKKTRLDYKSSQETGLRLIAVGGDSLSRGMTLEGLCVSYFFRNSQMYDTLLQMGRWFGYRDGYGDLCRLWMADEARYWYSNITEAVKELQEEIRVMEGAGLTPMDFGLKVRADPDSLLVTARNKMRTSRELERIVSFSQQSYETARLRYDKTIIHENASACKDLIETLIRKHFIPSLSPWKNTFWTGIPRDLISPFLERFEGHPLDIAFGEKSLARFIQTTNVPELMEWDIVIPNGEETETIFSGIHFRPQKRSVTCDRSTIFVSGTKARVGSRGIEREGLPPDRVRQLDESYKKENPGKTVPDKIYRAKRERPILFLHLLHAYDDKELIEGEFPLVALGFSFPKFDDSGVSSKVRYRINLVEWKKRFEQEWDEDMEEFS